MPGNGKSRAAEALAATTTPIRLCTSGRHYVRQAFSRFYQNRIDSVQLADYLDVKPARLERLEQEVLRRDIRP